MKKFVGLILVGLIILLSFSISCKTEETEVIPTEEKKIKAITAVKIFLCENILRIVCFIQIIGSYCKRTKKSVKIEASGKKLSTAG